MKKHFVIFFALIFALIFVSAADSFLASAETNTSLDSEKDKMRWLEVNYPPNGTGIVQVIDPDRNLDSEAIDYFDIKVWSDSDQAGIDLTVTETGKSTGIFEGTVFFMQFHSTSTAVRVAEGDTVTAEYENNTPPSSSPLLSDTQTTTAHDDNRNITATTFIGFSPYDLCNDYSYYGGYQCRQPTIKIVDAFGNTLNSVSVGQQIQVSTGLANGQNKEQPFVNFVQIQDMDGIVVSLEWLAGSLSAGQSFSPSQSWIPSEAGTYTATAFVWESVDNPTPLFHPVSTTITVLTK